jgi:two-component system cell cycle response regulator CpdR
MARILLAEDDSSMRQFLAMALEKAGHEVTACEDGVEALTALERCGTNDDRHELLLADIVMPGMDGIELSQKAARLNPNLKVMYITGFAGVTMGKRESDDTQILSKPFHLKDLVDQVAHLLAA